MPKLLFTDLPMRDRLVHAVTAYDRREAERARKSPRGHHNAYALAQYLERVDEIAADIAAGTSPRAAIIAAFDGRLRDSVLRFIGEPKATADEEHAEEMRPWTQGYTPVSDR